MGPTKVKTGSSRGNNKRSSKPSSSASSSKNKKQSSIHKAARASKSKVKKVQTKPKKKGRRWYPEEELQLPKLNMVTPAGVGKPKGKKKGKVFVDDPESMRTILAMVKAEKDGQIESKMIRARQMEEIRLARQKEMEARAEEKKAKLNETKDSLRRSRKKSQASTTVDTADEPTEKTTSKQKRKRVAFE